MFDRIRECQLKRAKGRNLEKELISKCMDCIVKQCKFTGHFCREARQLWSKSDIYANITPEIPLPPEIIVKMVGHRGRL